MLRAQSHVPAGSWPEAAEIDCVLIDYDLRHRRRFLLRTEGARDLLLDLPRAVQLRQDDGLVVEDGAVVRVRARPEPVLRLLADPHVLLRLAWHLGNRHLPVQIEQDALVIRADHVISAMAEGLGATVIACEAPFDPEPGAYHEPSASHEH